MGFSCTTVTNDEPWVFEELLGGARVFQGAKVQGELGPGPGGDPTLLSFTTTLGLLRGIKTCVFALMTTLFLRLPCNLGPRQLQTGI